MLRELAESFRVTGGTGKQTRIIALYAFLAILNAGAWAAAFSLFSGSPGTLGLCLVAYGFGLRHAIDADHIAAIDNATRKLIQDKRSSTAAGFFFSLGHSTVVVVMCCVVALGSDIVETHFPRFREVGGAIGLAVSAAFLLLLAAINFAIFLKVFGLYRAQRAVTSCGETAPDVATKGWGPLTRILRPLLRLVNRSWHMYPVGFLFGLGFDTTSEVALLGIAATQAAQQLPLWSIMVFPLLFTAGMCLVDTTDGILMTGAYGWALVNPTRKLYYNMVITFASFMIALVVGGLEAASVVATKLDLEGGAWEVASALGEHSGTVGLSIIGLLALCWLVSVSANRRGVPVRSCVTPPSISISGGSP